jgi:hypothetical protein
MQCIRSRRCNIQVMLHSGGVSTIRITKRSTMAGLRVLVGYILLGARLRTDLCRPPEQWTVCYDRHGDSPLDSMSITSISFYAVLTPSAISRIQRASCETERGMAEISHEATACSSIPAYAQYWSLGTDQHQTGKEEISYSFLKRDAMFLIAQR